MRGDSSPAWQRAGLESRRTAKRRPNAPTGSSGERVTTKDVNVEVLDHARRIERLRGQLLTKFSTGALYD